MKNIFLKNLIIFFIIFVGFYLRFYQLNFEDYWLDEHASFYSANPYFTFIETIERNEFIDGFSYLMFTLILKSYFNLFGYDPFIGRHITLMFGVLSLPLIGYLSYLLSDKKHYFLALFLVSINIYLINYSQELRPYSMLFFLYLLNIIFFYKLSENKLSNFKTYIYTFFFILFSVLSLTLLPFVFLILFSQTVYAIYIYFFFKKKLKLFFISLPLILVLYFSINYDFIINKIILTNYIENVYGQPWMKQIGLKFYYNYFFSRFFGSLIMGSIYLASLIYLLIKFRKKIFVEESKLTLLFFILVFSYLIPLVYGYIKVPVLLDRYIGFVLIPIILLISLLIFEIKNKKIKFSLLFFIITSTVINNFFEIKFRKHFKPELVKTIKYLQKTDVLSYSLKEPYRPETIILENYLTSLGKKNNKNIKYYELQNIPSSLSKIWVICYEPITGFDCSLSSDFTDSWKKIETKKFYHSQLSLYNKIKN